MWRGRGCGRAALVDQVPDLGEFGGAELRLVGLPELVGDDLNTGAEADEDDLVDDLGEGALLRRQQEASLGVDFEERAVAGEQAHESPLLGRRLGGANE